MPTKGTGNKVHIEGAGKGQALLASGQRITLSIPDNITFKVALSQLPAVLEAATVNWFAILPH